MFPRLSHFLDFGILLLRLMVAVIFDASGYHHLKSPEEHGFSHAFPGAPYPGDLPGHTTLDVTVGKDFGENFSLTVSALNIANRRIELHHSVTFGRFPWNNPREIVGELRYRFHF